MPVDTLRRLFDVDLAGCTRKTIEDMELHVTSIDHPLPLDEFQGQQLTLMTAQVRLRSKCCLPARLVARGLRGVLDMLCGRTCLYDVHGEGRASGAPASLLGELITEISI